MINELKHMLELQDELNKQVHPDWKKQGFEWYRAIWVECGELMDHYGYKWWKKQDPDRGQVILELIDIWHFGLSRLLESGRDIDDLAIKIKRSLPFAVPVDDPLAAVESFAQETLNTRGFNIRSFAAMCIGFNLSFHELYIKFIGKNVLNRFRQDHGYKDGTYQKIWNDREDNEVLHDILQKFMDQEKHGYSESIEHCIYTLLRAEYVMIN